MTAPDDLARLFAEHREVKPWVCLCGWWSAIQEPDGSDYARHLASVVSRRDADLRNAARHVVRSFREVEHNRQLYDVATHRCVNELARALDGEVAR